MAFQRSPVSSRSPSSTAPSSSDQLPRGRKLWEPMARERIRLSPLLCPVGVDASCAPGGVVPVLLVEAMAARRWMRSELWHVESPIPSGLIGTHTRRRGWLLQRRWPPGLLAAPEVSSESRLRLAPQSVLLRSRLCRCAGIVDVLRGGSWPQLFREISPRFALLFAAVQLGAGRMSNRRLEPSWEDSELLGFGKSRTRKGRAEPRRCMPRVSRIGIGAAVAVTGERLNVVESGRPGFPGLAQGWCSLPAG